MHQKLFSVALFISIVFGINFSASAQSEISLRAGFNNSKFTGDNLTIGSFGLNKGKLIGIDYSYRFNQAIALRTAVMYSHTKGPYVDADTINVDRDTLDYKLTGIGVPIDVIVWSKSGRFYVFTGLKGFMPFEFSGQKDGKNTDYSHTLKGVLLSAHFGAGVNFKITQKYILYFEASYNQGLADINYKFYDPNEDSYFPRTKIYSTKVVLGLKFSLGNSEYYNFTSRRKHD